MNVYKSSYGYNGQFKNAKVVVYNLTNADRSFVLSSDASPSPQPTANLDLLLNLGPILL